MQLYEFYGLARSGHHAVINWCVKNLSSAELPMVNKFQVIESGGIYYINEGNYDLGLTKNFLIENWSKIKYLIVGYENCDPTFSFFSPKHEYKAPLDFQFENLEPPTTRKRIILTRNFYDNLASRIKKNQGGIVNNIGENIIFPVDYQFVQQYKLYLNDIIEQKCYYLKFEDWLHNKSIRQKFLLEVFGIHELYSNESVRGTVSSFSESDRENLENRINQVVVSESIKNLVNSDEELKTLLEKVGYKIITL
jgi:hypothetical protein